MIPYSWNCTTLYGIVLSMKCQDSIGSVASLVNAEVRNQQAVLNITCARSSAPAEDNVPASAVDQSISDFGHTALSPNLLIEAVKPSPAAPCGPFEARGSARPCRSSSTARAARMVLVGPPPPNEGFAVPEPCYWVRFDDGSATR